jgi:hypothetical protein
MKSFKIMRSSKINTKSGSIAGDLVPRDAVTTEAKFLAGHRIAGSRALR